MDLQFESLPKFCKQCANIGHDWNSCRRRCEGDLNEGMYNMFKGQNILSMAALERGEMGHQYQF